VVGRAHRPPQRLLPLSGPRQLRPGHRVQPRNFIRGETAAVSTDELRFFELTGRRSRLLWLRHRDLSWYALAVDKVVLKPIAPSTLTISAVEPGTYRIEYWSPEQGKLLKSAEIAAKNASLEIPLPRSKPN